MMDDFMLDNLIFWYRLRIAGYEIRLAACRIRRKYLEWRRTRYAKQA